MAIKRRRSLIVSAKKEAKALVNEAAEVKEGNCDEDLYDAWPFAIAGGYQRSEIAQYRFS